MSDGRRRHPLRWSWRIFLVALAAAMVVALAWWLVGAPNMSRIYPRNEVTRFRPTAGHGVGQFLGESFLLALVAYAARRWFRVRL